MNREDYESYYDSMEKWAVEELGMAPYTEEEFEMDLREESYIGDV